MLKSPGSREVSICGGRPERHRYGLSCRGTKSSNPSPSRRESCELSVPGRRCGRPFADGHGSVESLPFDDNRLEKALAINSMQSWPQAVAGLREVQRVTKADGRIALGFSAIRGS